MTVLLDIDGVLLPWSGSTEGSGFTDFTKVKARHFSAVSSEQLTLIASSFTDIQWHTTWIAGDMANLHFTPITGFGPYPILVDRLSEHFTEDWYGFEVSPNHAGFRVPDKIIPPTLGRALNYARWWKLNAVAALLATDQLPGKVVWVDDDLPTSMGSVRQVLAHFDARDRFRLIAPDVIWEKDSIIAAAEWLAE